MKLQAWSSHVLKMIQVVLLSISLLLLTNARCFQEQHEEVVTIDGDEGKQSIVIQYLTSNSNDRHKKYVPTNNTQIMQKNII